MWCKPFPDCSFKVLEMSFYIGDQIFAARLSSQVKRLLQIPPSLVLAAQ